MVEILFSEAQNGGSVIEASTRVRAADRRQHSGADAMAGHVSQEYNRSVDALRLLYRGTLTTQPVAIRAESSGGRASDHQGESSFGNATEPLGTLCPVLAGLLALRWLSRWLAGGRWHGSASIVSLPLCL